MDAEEETMIFSRCRLKLVSYGEDIQAVCLCSKLGLRDRQTDITLHIHVPDTVKPGHF